ncbi:uncharacterized protein Dere_GG26210 [Drosophila erecta]|uniref:Uncharacterized protein n=1 Tax=Drosophila erecta TaxID=7220 RepID=A0A0Q5T3K6_DROER|nr:uncharacterized protein Dere_GG26210 [Drosophila erecta]
MHNLIKSRALFEILKKPLPPNYFNDDDDEENSEGNTSNPAGHLSPRLKKEESSDDESALDLTKIKKQLEILDAQKTNAARTDAIYTDQIKKIFDDQDKDESSTMALPLNTIPKRNQKPPPSAQADVFDDSDYVIVCRNKGKKTLLAKERRLEQDRKVALEALKLAEQRRMRDPLVLSSDPDKENAGKVQPVVHLSRSPIRFSLEDRIKVNRLRTAKKERIEHALLEIAKEKEVQLLQEQRKRAVNRYISTQNESEEMGAGDPVDTVDTVTTKKRFIPTAKEWDEQCRLKLLTLEKKTVTPVTTMTANRYIPTTKEWDEQRRAKHKGKMEAEKENIPAKTELPLKESNGIYNTTDVSSVFVNKVVTGTTAKPSCSLPTELETEKRKGNITHYKTTINWTTRKPPKMAIDINQQMESQQKDDQQEDRQIKKGSVQRYSIEELLKLEPQPEDLEDLNIKILSRLGI